MTRGLLVNADGFGFTEGVNRGIAESVESGIVRSTSCVVNFGHIAEVTAFHCDHPQVSIGIHFNLSVGRPVSRPEEIETLVDTRGMFLGEKFVRRLLAGSIRREHMVRELDRQAAILFDLGVVPSHWDGHQNKHLYPPFFFAAMVVARRRAIRRMRTHSRYLHLCDNGHRRLANLGAYYLRHPWRLGTRAGAEALMSVARARGFRMADRLLTPGYVNGGGKSHLRTWLDMIAGLKSGVSEIYCHPGYPDEELRAHAKYVDERRTEIDVLTSGDLRRAVEKAGVRLLSFHDL